MNNRAIWMSAALSLVFLQGVSTRAQTFQGPRPLTEAERQAVVFATEYLDRGPEAWWDRLASSSPLRTLGREAALEEIEVRAGEPGGARWELQAADPDFSESGAVFTLEFPSGVDDTLLVEMVEEKGAWKIESLRISAEAAQSGPSRRRLVRRRRRRSRPGACRRRSCSPPRSSRFFASPERSPGGASGRWGRSSGSPALSSWRGPWPLSSRPGGSTRRERLAAGRREVRGGSCARSCRSGGSSPARGSGRSRLRRPRTRGPPARSPGSGRPSSSLAGWICAAPRRS